MTDSNESETASDGSAASLCSTASELSMTLAGLRTAATVLREEQYERLPVLSGMLEVAAQKLEVLHERAARLEGALSYALTVERTNSNEWMKGFQQQVNLVLAADCDHRRCTYDGNELRLRSIRQALP